MAIYHSSDENTWKIIEKYSKNDKVIPIKANSKPDGWMGKNWACMEGFRHASG